MLTRRLVDADLKGQCDADQGWSMPTSKVEATENSDTSEKAGTSNSWNSKRSRNFGKHRNEEQSKV
jgi:hypothetical protein